MISVIIPAYNAEKYLGECLEGMRVQTMPDFEVIVVDDGSTDTTLAIAKSFAKKDARFHVFQEHNRGAGVARNVGMEHACGEYLLFFDADDIARPQMLEVMLARAEETNADVAVCRAWGFDDETGEALDVNYGPLCLDYNQVYSGSEVGDHMFDAWTGWAWDKLFRTSFVQEQGLQFQDLRSTNDAYFVFVGLCCAQRIAIVDSVCVGHRKHAGSIEDSRSATPHNAWLAHEKIYQRLHDSEVWPYVGRAFVDWCCAHGRWNFETLQGEARTAAAQDYLGDIDRAITYAGEADAQDAEDKPGRVLKNDLDDFIMQMRVAAGEDDVPMILLERADILFHQCQETESLRELVAYREAELAAREAQLATREAQLARASEELAARTAEAESLRTRLEQVQGSTSMRVGLALTAIPRRIKAAVHSLDSE